MKSIQIKLIETLKSYSLLIALAVIIAIAVPACKAKNAADAKAFSERQQAKAAACLASMECQDRVTKRESRRETDPLQSASGKWFFRGDECTADCDGHVAGYLWAERIGATKVAACDDASSHSFTEGCLAFVESNEPDIDYEQLGHPEEPEINGRYRD